MKTIKFIFIILVPFVISCDKQVDKITTSESLMGDWVWVKSEGGISGSTITPEITGERKEISFSHDSIYSTVYTIKDDLRTHTNATLFKTKKILYNDQVANVILLNGDPYQIFRFSDQRELILIDYGMMDGYTHYYKRIYFVLK